MGWGSVTFSDAVANEAFLRSRMRGGMAGVQTDCRAII
jgi:hypothetical protein